MSHLGGQTTKQTYVTTYTTSVDPRTLPDFATRGAAPAEEWRGGEVAPSDRRRVSAGPAPLAPHSPIVSPYGDEEDCDLAPSVSAASSSIERDGSGTHRMRKKYTTTTVTTITTTTILLPKMQEAYIFPSTTSHHMQQQHDAIGACGQGARHTITDGATHADASSYPQEQRRLSHAESATGSGSQLVPAQPQLGAEGEGTQAWAFQQHTRHHVEEQASRGRLPTLQDLGITSHFDNGSAPSQPRRETPYVPATSSASAGTGATPLRPQPWVAAETRYEVEGGKRYY
ncbi:hypothetical protein NESM_000855000 [Novymonas esmeraldas]|uniref:Uncharacterized protein n=1 Tax=Novymonas esmeraldas TaxID=1808958 RepID=A0AAW0EYF0_9TRYP